MHLSRQIIGGASGGPLHSLDSGASLARRIPGAACTVIEGAGGAILWTHGAEILAALLEGGAQNAKRSSSTARPYQCVLGVQVRSKPAA